MRGATTIGIDRKLCVFCEHKKTQGGNNMAKPVINYKGYMTSKEVSPHLIPI